MKNKSRKKSNMLHIKINHGKSKLQIDPFFYSLTNAFKSNTIEFWKKNIQKKINPSCSKPKGKNYQNKIVIYLKKTIEIYKNSDEKYQGKRGKSSYVVN